MKYKLIQFALITLFVLSTKSYPQAASLNASSRVIYLQNVMLEGSLLPCHGIMLNSLLATTPDCAKKVAHITSSSKATIDVAVYGYSAHHDLIEQIDSTYELSSDRTDRGILGLSQIPLSYQAAAILFNASDLIERTRGGTRSNQIISDVTAYYITLDSHSSEQLISHDFSLKYVDFSALKWEAASAKEKMIFQKLPPGTALTKDNKVMCLVDSDGKHCTYPDLFSRVKRATPVFDKTSSALQGECLGNSFSYVAPMPVLSTEAASGTSGLTQFFNVGECARGTSTICHFSINIINVENYTATYICTGICDATGTSNDFDGLLDDAIECLNTLEPTSPVTTTSEELTSTSSEELISTSSEELISTSSEELISTSSEELTSTNSEELTSTNSEELISTSSEELANSSSGELGSSTSLKSFVALFAILTQFSYLY